MSERDPAYAALRRLRRTRQLHRLGNIEWFDAAYRVYLLGLFGGGGILWISSSVKDGNVSVATADSIAAHAPAVLGLIAAMALLADLRGGADFAALARAQSADKGSAARGGDLGRFGPGKMVPEFDAAVFALRQPGDLAGPVKTQFGYHLIELRERTPGELRPFEQVLPELREELRTKLQATERKAVWDAVQERAQVDPAAVKALSDAHYRPIQIKP